MIRRPPRSTRTDTLFPYTTLFRSDLTEAGHQPMVSSCGRYVLVLNGEIYNHLDLRERLEAQAQAPIWRGHSDTETILAGRSEEHTSELQSLMRISYAVFCLKKKKKTTI